MDDEFLLFAGSASRRLGTAIAGYLGCELGRSELLHFSEGNLFVRVLENVRGRDVFLVQGTAFPANDNFMELLFWIDAIEAAGADRVVTLDLHAPQVQGFFRIPVDDLYAVPVLCDAIRARGMDDLVVVAPDAGFAKKARAWANRLRAPTAIADKRRVDHSESAEIVELIGSVEGRTALIVDDFTISAGTLVDAARVVVDRGATKVYAAVSHGLLAGTASQKLADSPIERLFMTDSVETQPDALPGKAEVVSVAGLFGEAIRRIARRESISVLFE